MGSKTPSFVRPFFIRSAKANRMSICEVPTPVVPQLFCCKANKETNVERAIHIIQKPWNHANFRKNALGAERPFSELWESSGVFSEQLSEFEIPFSEYEIAFSERHPTT